MPVNHLFYALDEELINTFRLGITLTEPIRPDILAAALKQAAVRFPFFSVRLVRSGESYVLEHNDAPFVISPDGKNVRLNSEESAYHLFAFAYKGNTLYMDASHFLTDGQGSFMFVKTILYCYLHLLHPDELFDTKEIALPDSPINPAEADEEPYPQTLFPESPLGKNDRPEAVFILRDQPEGYANIAGWTSFRFHICMEEILSYMSSVDGSPSTFFASLMYKSISSFYPDNKLPLVCGVQHSFRKALRKPFSHHCHVNIVPIIYPEMLREKDIERINTISRGLIILRADDQNDILTINKHIRREQHIKELSLSEKQKYVQEAIRREIGTNTFDISYTGLVPWSGIDRYITDVAPYIDISLGGGISMEIFSFANVFCINTMQRNSDPRYTDRFAELLTQSGVKYDRLPPEHFQISDFQSPE